MSRKIWKVNEIKKETAKEIAEALDIEAFTALILVSRGFDTVEKCRDFLSSEDNFCDPFDLIDMDKAVERINAALNNGEKICIYGDYDCDGVTSTAVLYSYLFMEGADVSYYIPDRSTEGYGLNVNAISKICEEGTDLIITVDNGVSAITEAEYISQLGMDLVVTDHHRVSDSIPECVAVVDPHRKDCPSAFKEWCGVGVVFKLICAMTDNDYLSVLDSYSDLITLGTIGDVVSLTGENRSIVKHGINKLNSDDKNPGLASLIETAGIKYPLNANSVAFYVGPRINATGRISKADNAVELLLCEDDETAQRSAGDIVELNTARQSFEQQIIEDINDMLEKDNTILFKRVLIFVGSGWHSGVIGIVAARMSEKYGKPCMVISTDGISAKGSARSIDGFSLFDCVTACSSLLTHYGGHPLAAGFSLMHENIEEFKAAVEDFARPVEMPFPVLGIDCKLRPQAINADLLPIIDSLEPFGQDNPDPVFGLYGMTVESVAGISNGKHIRLSLIKNGSRIKAMKFRTSPDEFPYGPGDVIDLAVTLSRNEYNGQISVSVYVKEVRPSSVNDELFLKSLRLYEKYKRGDILNSKELKFITPDRDLIGKIYKLIKNKMVTLTDEEIICYRAGDDGRHACTYMVATDVLEELGLLKRSSNYFILPNDVIRVNLDDSKILNSLKVYNNG